MKRHLKLFISILSCVILISIGYSAWIITNPTSKTIDGTITVDVVKDARIGIKAELDDNKIIFGSKESDPSNTYHWMKYEKNEAEEKLTTTLSITIINFSYLKNTDTALKLTVSEKDADSENSKYQQAFKKEYVSALPLLEYTKEQLDSIEGKTYDSTNDVFTCKIVIEFSWGSKFGNKNPIDYYNNQEYSDELAKNAIDTLTELHTLLNGVNYILTIETFTE